MLNNSLMDQTLALIRSECGSFKPEVAIVLGSGLGSLRSHVEVIANLPYKDLPVMPVQQVVGHQAELVLGELFGRKVALFCGRFHLYQGLSCFDSTVTVRLAAELGCNSVLLTCAVGGIDLQMKAGDFMLVTDHLNFTGLNPLQGIEPPVFIDLHDCYQHSFYASLKERAVQLNRTLHAGVLAYMAGPSYETPAEISALRLLGANAVSMSTIPEAIMSRALGLNVYALALITNMAGGSSTEKLSHTDVLACSSAAIAPFCELVKTLLSESFHE